MIKVALIHKHYRSNHLAQARQLLNLEGVETTFIELAGREATNPWERFSPQLPRFTSLSEACIERAWRPRLIARLRTVLTQLNPDVVVVAGYNAWPLRAAARWARARGKTCVLILDAVEHGRRRWKPLEWMKAQFVRRHFDAAFVGGQHGRAYAAKLGIPAHRIWEGYQALDNATYAVQAEAAQARAASLRAAVGLPERYFLFVGRLHHHKNPFRLLQAYARYRRHHREPWDLVIVGDGPLRLFLRWFVRTAHIPGVRWMGARRSEEMPLFYGLAKVLVVPSVAETWGPVVNEAMAAGLPVLVSNRCGCAPELVRPGYNGDVFNPYDVAQLASRFLWITSLSDGARAAMGRASRTLISGYTLDRWATTFLQCVMTNGHA